MSKTLEERLEYLEHRARYSQGFGVAVDENLVALRRRQDEMMTSIKTLQTAQGEQTATLKTHGRLLHEHTRMLGDLDHRVAGLDQKVTGLDERVAGLDQKVTGLDQKVTGLDERVAGLDQKVTGLDQRVAGLDGKMDQVLALLVGRRPGGTIAEN